VLFDCDGVLVDTERDGHRVAFNETFKLMGVPHEWDVPTYGRLLATGGGKERMTKYFNECKDQEPFKSITDAEEQQNFVRKLHKAKTELFQKMIEDGQMPLRPGVAQLVGACATVALEPEQCAAPDGAEPRAHNM
jgi:beta-phosphoglucomutase-like phosphatase (HAD superfamily)